VLGGDDIRENNEHLGPTAACSLEGRDEVALAMHWQEQEFKAKLSARSFDCANGIVCPGIGRVPEDSDSGKARESFSEQR
jgi:hypothetical protein